ncbi:MAG: hypothetical protein WCE38_11315, partial [Burkholderiales bacterium]
MLSYNNMRKMLSPRAAQYVSYALIFVFLLQKLAYNFFYFDSGAPFSEIGYGFGEYIDALVKSGSYSSCHEYGCSDSSRMPFIPLFYSTIGRVAEDQLQLAIGKNIIMSIFFAACATALMTVYKPI